MKIPSASAPTRPYNDRTMTALSFCLACGALLISPLFSRAVIVVGPQARNISAPTGEAAVRR